MLHQKVCKAFLRRKLIYSISMLVCSIRAGVFNVNPQSGIEFPNGSLLIVQLKSRAIKGHMGPVSVQEKKKKAVGVYLSRNILSGVE